MPYHISKDGKLRPCKVKNPAACRLGRVNKHGEKLVLSHGVEVVKNKITISDFQTGSPRTRYGIDGKKWYQIIKMVKQNWDNQLPGTGSVNGDTILVPIPADGFTTSIIDITEDNEDQVEVIDYIRRKGEEPVPHKIIRTLTYPPAKVVRVVVYRADTLARDNDRSSDAEWEIVAVLRQPADNVPMDLETMKRNSSHKVGGTYREYTPEQWSEAEKFWNNHAYAWTPEDEEYQRLRLSE
jgi:hypothetical protein